jgi:hypothetical protein
MSYKPRSLFRISEDVNRSLFLPHIQRPFVWDEDQMHFSLDTPSGRNNVREGLTHIERRILMGKINLSQEELVAYGERHRLDYLVEQTGYTLGVAAEEWEGLKNYLDAETLDEARALHAELISTLQNRRLVEDDAREATREQNRLFGEAKTFRRRVSHLARAWSRQGVELPQGLINYSSARNLPAVARQVEEMLSQLEASKEKIRAPIVDELIAEGRRLAQAFRAQDAAQEQKRLSKLPAAVKELNAKKGRLYLTLKAINDAGRALHAADPFRASRYSLSILHRRSGGNTPGDQATGQ